MSSGLKSTRALPLLFVVYLSTTFAAQAQVQFVGLGDSIGEGVQSADANEFTQPFSYLNLIASRIGGSYPLPLIRTSIFGFAGDTSSRSRIDPSVAGLNLAVNGTDVFSLLNDRADAGDASQIDSETDMVLFPRIGSQMEVAERLRPFWRCAGLAATMFSAR
jgi:hypothetical protein